MAVSVENSLSRVSDSESNLEVLIGTYEEFILGYKLKRNPEGGLIFVPSFTNHSHCGSIRSLAASPKYLATGSTDESIRLFSLKDRNEHGFLQQHNGTITCLEFFHQGYLFSGSDDGNVCVWNTRTWKCEKTLKAHLDGVTALSVHPSGKLALTVGKDRAMKTWNLIKGRTAYVTNIKAIADAVQWSPQGTVWSVAVNNSVNIYEVTSAGIKHTIDFKNRINFVKFLDEDTVVIGGEAPNIEIHSTTERKLLTSFKAHEKRAKAGDITKLDGSDKPHLVTASNDGFIKLWRIEDANTEAVLLAQIDTTCRITCMCLSTETVKKIPEGDVKPAVKKPVKRPAAVATEDSNRAKPLKSLLKINTNRKSSVIKTSSGAFIAEPIKEHSIEKRPRLTFAEKPMEKV